MTDSLQGIAVSPGVAIASARCLHNLPPTHAASHVDESRLLIELAAFETALQNTVGELQALRDKVASRVGEEEAAIFQAHIAIAQDPALSGKVRQLITESHLTAVTAVQKVMEDYERLFANVSDEYLKQRVIDLRDVLRRLAQRTLEADPTNADYGEQPVILVVHELLPSDVVAIYENQVHGIVTQTGGRTSHAAILARSYGIPAIAGVQDVFEQVNNGDVLVLDGTAGRVFVNPGAEIKRAYGERRREFVQLREQLAHTVKGRAVTKDGEALRLYANINCADDIFEAQRVGADGIGLYRTEFFYLNCAGVPTEEQEVDEYRQVVSSSLAGPVTIRTLDLGGDKTIPFLTHAPEANPFMGWRSIRLSFEHPDLFRQQIRAVLRAAHGTNKEVRLLFPMITTIEELQQIHEFVEQARDKLSDMSEPFGNVKVGMMMEVPAAAVMIDQLVELVDFVSIGTNDLVQYLTAADRDNPKVSHLCQALSPAVLRVLNTVISTCRHANTPVSVCGEMAGSPRAYPLLLGMGLRCFSMSASFIPVIRDLAAKLPVTEAEEILTCVLRLTTSKEIHRAMDDHVLRMCPELHPFLVA